MKIFKRIMALILVVLLIAIYAVTCILGIMGSEYFTGMLFLCVIVPVLCYAVSLITRVLRKKGEELKDESEK
ncbi:MAG: hypothetical protein J6L77_08975 [Coprococcus sp.]|nr:hypothetical protein [Coprococcus sp.]